MSCINDFKEKAKPYYGSLKEKINIQKNDFDKVKYTIGYKMTIIIVAIMVLSLMTAGVFSSFFLSRYYTKTKQDSIKKVYSRIADISVNDAYIEESANVSALNDICEKLGATMIVVDSAGDTIYDYGAGKMLADRWRDMIFGSDTNQKETPRLIEKNDNYTIQSTVDRASTKQYYELSGGVASGNYVVIRMSVESFRESIAIANKFYLGLGIALIIITTIAIVGMTRRYTIPLLQLSDISKRMSELDFNVKYEGVRNDEIGILGESMNEMSEKLENTITELKAANIELHKDIARKEEVDEMRKEFISNVSHELKTPIALIQGYAEGLQEGISENPEDMQYYCDVIVDEANKMNKMVKNLLALNQLEFGNGMLNMERFDLTSVIVGVINSMKIKADEKNVNIQFEQNMPVYVWADEFQIEEVITNYLSNALNHVDDNKIVHLKIVQNGNSARVSVFNSGKRIPDNELENIWVKFYKVDKARTRAYGGNGIGLSIVKAIMERHGKNYGVNNYDDGVEFWFELDCNTLEIKS